jgi:hypothetical protein
MRRRHEEPAMSAVNSDAIRPSAPVRFPPDESPRLTVVVDTEEEFDWTAPYSRSSTSVTAMRHIGRAQAIFDRFGLRPTYVVDYPVASQPGGYEPLREIFARGGCEVGAHLHPWVTPPHDEEVGTPNSFTANLPADLQRAKIDTLREAIVEHFGTPPRMFKAGRYGIGATTVGILESRGFDIDGSVCPRFDFSGEGGPSFRAFDASLFFCAPTILEIPCTVDYTGWSGGLRPVLHRLASANPWARLKAVGVLARLGAANQVMLSPEGNTCAEMCALARALVGRGQRVFTLSFHSPSADVGHTPYVRTERDLEAFLRTIDEFCEFFMGDLGGVPATTSEIRTLAQSRVERDS